MDSRESDERSMSLLYVSLFNQRHDGTPDLPKWEGDWLFRRERLLLVDRFLGSRKPDIAIFQESLSREGASSESDFKIIGRGSLRGYQWDNQEVAYYSDTNEIEYHSLAAGLPLQPVELASGFKRYWKLPDGGHLVFFLAELNGVVIPIFSVELQGSQRENEASFAFIEKEIRDTLKKYQFCPTRLIVVGKMPALLSGSGLGSLMASFGLKDATEGFCDIASDCFTATPINEIFMRTSSGMEPSQMDRILVPRSAQVFLTSIELKNPAEDKAFMLSYGIPRIWPTERFGLFTNIRLQECSDEDYL